jgi:uroporphyrinogen decarboxylase
LRGVLSGRLWTYLQSTLAFGTPEDVRREVKDRIETVGKGGGLLIAPAHTVERPTPPENVIAFFRAIDDYGMY